MEQPNLNYINELSGDNLEFKKKIISILKKELSDEIGVYVEQLKNANYFLASQSVHKLKHKISILSLEKSYYIAEEYENNLKNNTTKLDLDFQNILKNMQEFVNRL
ncbi:Hpt domain-containing protein [Flavobacterium sp. W22_SRS_FP1]|uniref:Hpt domain-containing protein n=1 Tax=Flavobacterium sp. W22_SRS_FP1 TaxID=3240276 RepID=UPI003F8E9888